MVPSTDDKLERKQSPGGRIMQGRKGVGRYAASILGDDLRLETISNNILTTVYVEWAGFERAKFLDEVEIQTRSQSKLTALLISNFWAGPKIFMRFLQT